MRIAFNTLSENPRFPSGSMNFFIQITKKLLELDTGNEYFIFASKTNKSLFTDKQQQEQTVVVGMSNESKIYRIISENTSVPFFLRKLNIDIFFNSSSGGSIPLFFPTSCRAVCAIYGTHHLFKSAEIGMNLGILRKFFRRGMNYYMAKRADKVIVNSKSSMKDIIQKINIDNDKIRIIYHGIDPKYFNDNETTEKNIEYYNSLKIKTPYILFVSVIWSYKNADTLLKAFNLLCQNPEFNYTLVIVGNFDTKSGSGYEKEYKERFIKLARDYKILNRVKFVGYVPNENLYLIYKNASVYVQPSLHETFGKTTVEAMMSGCPVIGANISSTPEIIGDAGLIFEPLDENDLAMKINMVISNTKLSKELRLKGIERAKNFTMEREAKELIKIFNELK